MPIVEGLQSSRIDLRIEIFRDGIETGTVTNQSRGYEPSGQNNRDQCDQIGCQAC